MKSVSEITEIIFQALDEIKVKCVVNKIVADPTGAISYKLHIWSGLINSNIDFETHTYELEENIRERLHNQVEQLREQIELEVQACASASPANEPMTGLRIIAVDFDGCICTNGHWPEVGTPINSTIKALAKAKEAGAKLILWTCRRDEALTAALDACKQWGVPEFDAINENLPEVVMAYGGKDSRKITATEYWDDRAVPMPRLEVGA